MAHSDEQNEPFYTAKRPILEIGQVFLPVFFGFFTVSEALVALKRSENPTVFLGNFFERMAEQTVVLIQNDTIYLSAPLLKTHTPKTKVREWTPPVLS